MANASRPGATSCRPRRRPRCARLGRAADGLASRRGGWECGRGGWCRGGNRRRHRCWGRRSLFADPAADCGVVQVEPCYLRRPENIVAVLVGFEVAAMLRQWPGGDARLDEMVARWRAEPERSAARLPSSLSDPPPSHRMLTIARGPATISNATG